LEQGANPGLKDMAKMWHTPDSMPEAPNTGSNCKNRVPGLGNQANLWATPDDTWPTPRAGELTGRGAAGRKPGTGGRMLDETAKEWATPRADKTTSEDPEVWQRRKDAGDVSTPPLTMQASSAMESLCSLPAQETEKVGGGCSKPGQTSPLRLNARFVEYLMGWPEGWTSFGCSETEFVRFKRRMQSALWSLLRRRQG
jgi:hypothetical protein